MKNNLIIIAVLALVIGGIGGFLGGTFYQKSQRPQTFQFGAAGRQQGGNGNFRTGQNARNGLAPVTGEIIDVDDKSITVKLEDGSSKIVLLSKETSISKSDNASVTDLKKGGKIAAFGTQNSDGSITAQNIQLNPTLRRIQVDPATSQTTK